MTWDQRVLNYAQSLRSLVLRGFGECRSCGSLELAVEPYSAMILGFE